MMIEIKDITTREQASSIRAALADPVFRATALVVGSLMSLPNDDDRRYALQEAVDQLAKDEPQEARRGLRGGE